MLTMVIGFPDIQARPKTNILKLKPNYLPEADPTGATGGNWVLSPKGIGNAVFEGYNFAVSSNGKTPDSAWADMPETRIPVAPYGSPKIKYLVRTAPIVTNFRNVPASKAFKITPAIQGKAPNLRPNYKKNVLPLKAGMSVQVADEINATALKKDFSITELDGKTIEVWQGATSKKPASAKQLLVIDSI
ncbi:hypothetical protein FACS18949_13010 [Clostridia bacterium]|nr:hypothetical protein FACS189425_04310 [Clostridia bacterium]GHV35310.1 hypothetical protein FACS18949_13010 [Clostridia bacterium]